MRIAADNWALVHNWKCRNTVRRILRLESLEDTSGHYVRAAGALIVGSGAMDGGERRTRLTGAISGSWEIACNLLMQHVRFFPWLEKSHRKISDVRGTLTPLI